MPLKRVVDGVDKVDKVVMAAGAMEAVMEDGARAVVDGEGYPLLLLPPPLQPALRPLSQLLRALELLPYVVNKHLLTSSLTLCIGHFDFHICFSIDYCLVHCTLLTQPVNLCPFAD